MTTYDDMRLPRDFFRRGFLYGFACGFLAAIILAQL